MASPRSAVAWILRPQKMKTKEKPEQSEMALQLLRLLETEPALSQRKLAEKLDVSLGKLNYCLKALIDVGLLKIENFSRNPSKKSYLYLLTSRGFRQKSALTLQFLNRKQREYEALQKEIDELKCDIQKQDASNSNKIYKSL